MAVCALGDGYRLLLLSELGLLDLLIGLVPLDEQADEVDEDELEEGGEGEGEAQDDVNVEGGGVTNLGEVVEMTGLSLLPPTLGLALPPKPILVTERMVMMPRATLEGVSVFTTQKATQEQTT